VDVLSFEITLFSPSKFSSLRVPDLTDFSEVNKVDFSMTIAIAIIAMIMR